MRPLAFDLSSLAGTPAPAPEPVDSKKEAPIQKLAPVEAELTYLPLRPRDDRE